MSTTTLTVIGLTPALIGAGLSFDVATVLKAWPSDAARTAGDTPRYNAAKRGLNTLPFTSPLYRYDANIAQVTGVLVGVEAVSLTVAGLTPDLIGAGLSFDVAATEAGSSRFLATAGNPMAMDVHLLTEAAVYESEENRTDDEDAIGRETKRYSDLPGGFLFEDALGFELGSVEAGDMPVEFDVSKVMEGYESAALRLAADPAARVFALEYNPGTNPPPFTAPAIAPNEPGSPVIGSARMLSGAPAVFEYTLNAAGTFEGAEDEDYQDKGTVQPVGYEKALQVSSLTAGRETYCIRSSRRYKTVVDEGSTDYVEIEGVATLAWQNTRLAHYENYVSSYVPVAGGDR
jgi:hypothetical protein